MTPGPATDRRAAPRRAWMGWLATTLVLVLAAIAYVQWHQFKLLDTASHFQNDALGWSFSQLETEQLRLRNVMQSHLDDSALHGLAEVRLRYDIFVSRVGLVDHERAASIMAQQNMYGPAVAKVQAFIREADQWLGEKPSMPLNLEAVVHLLPMLDELGVPLHDLALGASHLLYQRATERNNAVRQQTQMGIALTAFQCLLMFALAFIVLRQFRSITERRRTLETLADTLGTARREADAANRAKSVFLANMSHEIRTPFHGMLGMMSLLQDSRLTPQQQAMLGTARESAEHLLDILNDILDISRLESGKLQVLPVAIDLHQLRTSGDHSGKGGGGGVEDPELISGVDEHRLNADEVVRGGGGLTVPVVPLFVREGDLLLVRPDFGHRGRGLVHPARKVDEDPAARSGDRDAGELLVHGDHFLELQRRWGRRADVSARGEDRAAEREGAKIHAR